MKYTIAFTAILVILFIMSQAFTFRQQSSTERHAYEVLHAYPDFEVRRYAPALFTAVDLEGMSYRENSGNGFRILAGYIFGGNERNEKIAMTSPVVMEMGDQMTMKFMVPSALDPQDLPKPKDARIAFETQNAKIMATISFGGWADDAKIESYRQKLQTSLEKEGLSFKGPFQFYGYNPPYEVTNRRNEVAVELVDFRIPE